VQEQARLFDQMHHESRILIVLFIVLASVV
jgi:hypothetical protein